MDIKGISAVGAMELGDRLAFGVMEDKLLKLFEFPCLDS
jgi:hypothetical protein